MPRWSAPREHAAGFQYVGISATRSGPLAQKHPQRRRAARGAPESSRRCPRVEKPARREAAVLSLVTTKTPQIESKDDLERRIDQAARFAPLEQLALSPQCGFESGIGGNTMTIAQEMAKLRLVVETAQEVWGSV